MILVLFFLPFDFGAWNFMISEWQFLIGTLHFFLMPLLNFSYMFDFFQKTFFFCGISKSRKILYYKNCFSKLVFSRAYSFFAATLSINFCWLSNMIRLPNHLLVSMKTNHCQAKLYFLWVLSGFYNKDTHFVLSFFYRSDKFLTRFKICIWIPGTQWHQTVCLLSAQIGLVMVVFANGQGNPMQVFMTKRIFQNNKRNNCYKRRKFF